MTREGEKKARGKYGGSGIGVVVGGTQEGSKCRWKLSLRSIMIHSTLEIWRQVGRKTPFHFRSSAAGPAAGPPAYFFPPTHPPARQPSSSRPPAFFFFLLLHHGPADGVSLRPGDAHSTPLALMTRGVVARVMAGAPHHEYDNNGREWYYGYYLELEYDAAGSLQFVAINTGRNCNLQLVVHGRDLAHMPQYKVCGWIRAMDPSATENGWDWDDVVSNRLGLQAWNDYGNQFDPTAPPSRVSFRPRSDEPPGPTGNIALRGARFLSSLAWCFEVGHNVDVDRMRAQALYEDAAANGSIFARVRCAQMGWSSPINTVRAFRLYVDTVA